MLLFYVDDSCVFYPQSSDIDNLTLELGIEFVVKDKVYRAFWLIDEGSISEYLGVKIKSLPDGRIELSQPHLIDKIIE